jgi:NTE family protein
VDGSLSDDLPMKRLSRLYGVNHFIVSQTNPLILPFLKAEKGSRSVLSTISGTALKSMKDWGLAASHLMQKPFSNSTYMSKLINGYISLVSQTYTGDINILPASRFLSPAKALASRSSEEVMELLGEGERATWPAIERIRIQTHVSRTLNEIIEELDANSLNGGRRAAHPKRKVSKKLALVDKGTDKKLA